MSTSELPLQVIIDLKTKAGAVSIHLGEPLLWKLTSARPNRVADYITGTIHPAIATGEYGDIEIHLHSRCMHR